MKQKNYNFPMIIFCLFFFCWWAIRPLLQPGFFPMHDDTQVARVYQLAQALKDGQFPVRWVKDLGYGYGYPLFNFYGQLAYYCGGFFNLIGLNALLATKLMFALGILLAGVFMYWLASEIFGPIGGLLSALFYVYAPYHALDIYVRGAVGEFWAMAFLPLVFLGIYKLYRQQKTGLLISIIGFSAIILSHNLTALMLLPFLLLTGIILFFLSKNKQLFAISYTLFVLFSLALSAFYWLPALAEMNLTKVAGQIGGGADWQDHFVFIDQLWASPWGFGGSAPGRFDGMSFMIGKIHLIFVLFAFLTVFWFWYKKKYKLATGLAFFLFAFLLCAFLTTAYSRPIWQAIPIMAFIQYPWRFLALTSFFASFTAGSIGFFRLRRNSLVWLGTVLIVFALLFLNIKYFNPQVYLNLSAENYLTEENIKWKTSKISDEYLPKEFPAPISPKEVAWEKVIVLSGKAEIKNLREKSAQAKFLVEAETPVEVLVNTAYFSGWQVRLNGQKIQPTIKQGKMILSLPVGESIVNLKFINTPIRTYANSISFISFLAIFLVYRRKKSSEA